MELNRETLINLVKASGQELIDRADDIVGKNECRTDFRIWIKFLPDCMPTIEVIEEFFNRRAINVIMEE